MTAAATPPVVADGLRVGQQERSHDQELPTYRTLHSLNCVNLEEDDKGTVVAWYDLHRQQWR